MLFLTKRVKHDFLESCAKITKGRLRLRTPEGEHYDFGAGQPEAELVLHDWSVVTTAAARGDIGMGEAFTEGLWETPSIRDLTAVVLMNLDAMGGYAYGGFWNRVKFRMVNTVLRANTQRGAARNIHAHYDVGNEFYQLWLDDSMTYSSALFDQSDDLTQGQARKYDRILNRLNDGEQVLEIGCGWGGFAERAADQGRAVSGLTISPSQKGYADARLDGRAQIKLKDYRAETGTYDNIVSIEMIEAVGERYWPTYFKTLKARLAEGGRAMVQAITVPDDYFPTYRKGSDYIRHYTFPGGMLLSDKVIRAHAHLAGLKVREIHGFGQDYARTCAIWQDRLEDSAAKIRKLGYGEEFLRSWRYYLGICSAAFAVGQTDVVQVELAHV